MTTPTTQREADERTLPCPFCGNADEVYVGVATYCDHCGAEGPSYFIEGKPVAKWNDRAATDQPSAALDLSVLPLYYKEGIENGGYYLATDVIRLNGIARASLTPTAPADRHTLLDDLESAIAGWGGDLVDKIEAIIQKYRSTPDCGACPGDGSICKTECRHRAENPPYEVTPTAPQAAPQPYSEDVLRFGIQVEKMLCAALGREWSTSGISIESLIAELTGRAPQAASPQADDPRIAAFYTLRDIAERDNDIESANIIQDAISRLHWSKKDAIAPQAATTATCQPSTLTGQPDAAICQPAATTASQSAPPPKQGEAHALAIAANFDVQYDKSKGVHHYHGFIENVESLIERAALTRAPLPAKTDEEPK